MAEARGAGGDLDRWLAPFLAALGHKKRRTWAPLYLRGLMGPGERKSLQPMAARLGLPGHDQLHHVSGANSRARRCSISGRNDQKRRITATFSLAHPVGQTATSDLARQFTPVTARMP